MSGVKTKRPVLSKLFRDFLSSERSGGMILIICTVCSLIITNSSIGALYIKIWDAQLFHHSVTHWINDALMAVFFLLIGLELEREIYAGELSGIKNAILPVSGALGGMLVPAGIFMALNFATPTASGSGIPMATDIAFALGILSLMGNKVPASLKIFLTALAVIDDLGAIIVIAVFYSGTMVWTNLIISLSIFALLLIFNRLKIKILLLYLVPGIVMWYFMWKSGVHATITGVLLAFAIPFGNGNEKSISYKLQHFLHKPVAFIILPLFALANTAIVIASGWQTELGSPYALGIILGLVIGKPLGIFLFTFITVKLKIASLPSDLNWKNILGAGLLGGIGFTMSIFITLLAFNDPVIINNAKLMIMLGSLSSAILGLLWLQITLKTRITEEE